VDKKAQLKKINPFVELKIEGIELDKKQNKT
jgi:hypothetical protein